MDLDMLRHAVLNHDSDYINRLDSRSVSMLERRQLEEVVSLAERTQDARMLTTVLRVVGDYPYRQWAALLSRYVEQISQETSAAGWLEGIEFILWAAARGSADVHAEIIATGAFPGLAELTESQTADLRFLAERAAAWPTWDESRDSIVMMPISEWEELFERWGAS